MNWRAIWAIVRRDLKIVTRSKGVMIPMIIVPLVLMGVLPAAIGATAPLMSNVESELDDMAQFLEMMPPEMKSVLSGYTPAQTLIVAMLLYLFAPLFLILPLMVASTIAADSFAGERERKTMEALLYTPTTDTELFVGKMLAAWVPALAVTLAGFVLYGLAANLSAWPTMGELFFPNAMWIVLVLWVAPAAAALGLGVMILVSSKVGTFQEAYQMGSAVVLPILLLMFGQIGGVLYFSVGVVLIVGAVLWAIDAVVLWFAIRLFQRSEIIARL